jgi:hypothetical protein
MKKKKRFPEERRYLITQLKRFDYGHALAHRLLAPISFILAMFTLLKVYGISFTAAQILLAGLAAVFLMFLAGLIWDRCGMIEEEIEYANERNRFVKAMLKKTWLKKLDGARIAR